MSVASSVMAYNYTNSQTQGFSVSIVKKGLKNEIKFKRK